MRKILIFAVVLIPFVVNRVTPDDYDSDLDCDGDTTSERIAASHGNHSIFGAAVGAIISNNPTLQSFVTPAVRALVRRRLTGGSLVNTNSQMNEKEKLEAKIALLLVREACPYQEFYPAEIALMKGISHDSLLKGENRSTKSI
jgi:hypothetical protein